ncbi:MAG: hypothetical protein NTW49_14420 [Bacteroidia bacterium]|nr:hypothetical protein [Bacteroidia bacterium]
MSTLDSKKTYQNLKKKGFTDSPNKSADHKYLDLFHKGKYVAHTKFSHGNNEIDNYLIKQMSFQCKLDKNEFINLAKCPLSKKEYFDILDRKGFLK